MIPEITLALWAFSCLIIAVMMFGTKISYNKHRLVPLIALGYLVSKVWMLINITVVQGMAALAANLLIILRAIRG